VVSVEDEMDKDDDKPLTVLGWLWNRLTIAVILIMLALAIVLSVYRFGIELHFWNWPVP
jgi:hypothetical protein